MLLLGLALRVTGGAGRGVFVARHGVVARRAYGRDKVVDRERVGIVCNSGGLGGKIHHGAAHAGHALERPLDDRLARRARHADDAERGRRSGRGGACRHDRGVGRGRHRRAGAGVAGVGGLGLTGRGRSRKRVGGRGVGSRLGRLPLDRFERDRATAGGEPRGDDGSLDGGRVRLGVRGEHGEALLRVGGKHRHAGYRRQVHRDEPLAGMAVHALDVDPVSVSHGHLQCPVVTRR